MCLSFPAESAMTYCSEPACSRNSPATRRRNTRARPTSRRICAFSASADSNLRSSRTRCRNSTRMRSGAGGVKGDRRKVSMVNASFSRCVFSKRRAVADICDRIPARPFRIVRVCRPSRDINTEFWGLTCAGSSRNSTLGTVCFRPIPCPGTTSPATPYGRPSILPARPIFPASIDLRISLEETMSPRNMTEFTTCVSKP